MSTAVVWFRRDLRVRDLPALATACREHDEVVPLFVFDRKLLAGRFRCANRTQWLLEALDVLDASLRERGGRLVFRDGDVVEEVVRLAREVGADAVHCSADVTGFGRRRDAEAGRALAEHGIAMRGYLGNWIADLAQVETKQGAPYTVFSPFYRNWAKQPRRAVEEAPDAVPTPASVDPGRRPDLTELGFEPAPELVDRPEPGEEAGLRVAEDWLETSLEAYDAARDDLAQTPSRLSVYLRYGCVSPLWLESRVLGQEGGEPFRRELAFRDFFASVQLHFPHTARTEYQERMRALEFDDNPEWVEAWKAGRTGFPIVDAAMRQLQAMGYMHNRARLIVGSFLVKDLQQDWRIGEAHFMHHLLDGDVPSNNGGWQWIASTGTDPAPYFQRLYNPDLQAERHDPTGAYVRRWVPELGTPDYPEPIVDHATARRRAIERYRAVSGD